MPTEQGKKLLLKIGDGATVEVFTTVGGLRSNSFKVNNEFIDTTNKDSNGIRELMEGGVSSVDVSGSGVAKNEALGLAALQTASFDPPPNKKIRNFQIIDPGVGTYQGPFAIADFEKTGEHNGEVTYSVSLNSAGPITFTAV